MYVRMNICMYMYVYINAVGEKAIVRRFRVTEIAETSAAWEEQDQFRNFLLDRAILLVEKVGIL